MSPELQAIVNGDVTREKALSGACRPQAQPHPLSSSNGPMRNLGPVGLVARRRMQLFEINLAQRSVVGAKPVRHGRQPTIPAFVQQVARALQRRTSLAPGRPPVWFGGRRTTAGLFHRREVGRSQEHALLVD